MLDTTTVESSVGAVSDDRVAISPTAGTRIVHSATIHQQALLDLGLRGRFDSVYFLVANAAFLMFEPRVLDYRIFSVYSVISVISNLSMLLYLRYWDVEATRNPKRATWTFSVLKALTNLSLSCLVATAFVYFGINAVTSLATISTVAFAYGTVISLRPNAKVLWLSLCCCVVPPLLASAWIGGRAGYGNTFILSGVIVYLWFHGKRESIEYLQSLYQTMELQRARRRATKEGARISDALLTNAARHTATVAERNRIAYEWHDTLLAGFSAISWQLDEASLRQQKDPQHAAEAIELARKMVHHYRAEARLVVADLLYEESDAKDLVSLIEKNIPRIVDRAAVELSITSSGRSSLLSPDVTSQLLRICQEAVTNSVRHASPSSINLKVEFGVDQIAISIIDDGCGFAIDSHKPSHFGLQIMKQRARRLGGQLVIKSALGRGTSISVSVPYSADFTMAPTRILVIEDQYFSRLALHTVIDSHPDMKIVAETDTGKAGIIAFQEQPPDVTIVDLKLPDQSGIDVIRALRAIDPTARIVVLSNFDGSEYLHRATDAGAMAYLTKDSNAEELLQAIRAVRLGQSFIPSSLLHLLESRVSGNDLTSREHGVLELLVLGWSNKQIGDHLGIAEKTVRIHMSSIFAKLGAANRTQAVLIALQRGFVDPQPSERIESFTSQTTDYLP